MHTKSHLSEKIKFLEKKIDQIQIHLNFKNITSKQNRSKFKAELFQSIEKKELDWNQERIRFSKEFQNLTLELSQLNTRLFDFIKVEELIDQKEELKIRIDSILGFEFPLVTTIHEYHEFLPEVLKKTSELQWVQWLRSHLRVPDREGILGHYWSYDISSKIQSQSLQEDSERLDHKFIEYLNCQENHLKSLSNSFELTSQEKSDFGNHSTNSQSRPFQPRTVPTKFIDQQVQSGVRNWQEAWQNFRKIADGKTSHTFGELSCFLSKERNYDSKGSLQPAVSIQHEGSPNPPKILIKENFGRVFRHHIKRMKIS